MYTALSHSGYHAIKLYIIVLGIILYYQIHNIAIVGCLIIGNRNSLFLTTVIL